MNNISLINFLSFYNDKLQFGFYKIQNYLNDLQDAVDAEDIIEIMNFDKYEWKEYLNYGDDEDYIYEDVIYDYLYEDIEKKFKIIINEIVRTKQREINNPRAIYIFIEECNTINFIIKKIENYISGDIYTDELYKRFMKLLINIYEYYYTLSKNQCLDYINANNLIKCTQEI